MVINVPGLSNMSTSPGAPSPITFGMQNGLMDSAAITPGAGAMGYYGDSSPFNPSNAGGIASSSGSAVGPATAAAQNAVYGQPATNLGGVTVNAYAPTLQSMVPITGASAGISDNPFGIDGSNLRPNIDLKNMLPVKVTAQSTVTPSWYDTLNMMANDHPVMTGLLGSVTNLSPVITTAHALWNAQHGVSLLDSLNPLGGSVSHMLSALGSGGGLGNTPPDPHALNSLLHPPASNPGSPGIGSGGAGSSLFTSGPLPDYASLHALGNFGAPPVGGYWNQQALKMAAPAYGPYAGYGGAAPQPINYANPYAPSGITSAGY